MIVKLISNNILPSAQSLELLSHPSEAQLKLALQLCFRGSASLADGVHYGTYLGEDFVVRRRLRQEHCSNDWDGLYVSWVVLDHLAPLVLVRGPPAVDFAAAARRFSLLGQRLFSGDVLHRISYALGEEVSGRGFEDGMRGGVSSRVLADVATEV